MSSKTAEVIRKIQNLTDIDKLKLVDAILTDLDKPDSDIDRIWAKEAGRRWNSYKKGRQEAISCREVMAKYRTR